METGSGLLSIELNLSILWKEVNNQKCPSKKMEVLYVVLSAVITVFALTFLTRMKQGMSPLDVVNDATTSAISTIKQEKTAGNPSERKAIGLALELYSEDK